MAVFADSGVDKLPFDAGHEMILPKGPDSHKALGWFVPEVRQAFGEEEPSLYASQVQWTEAATEALMKREYRFFSPAIHFNRETRRIESLRNVALVNIPATKGQKPLVLSDDGETTTTEPTEEAKMEVLLNSLGASDEAGAVAKLADIKKGASALLSALDAPSVDDAVGMIENLKTQAKAGIEAQAALAAVTKERAAEKRGAAIELLCSEGKLLGSQKEFAATLSDDQFEAFASTLSASAVLSAPSVEEVDSPVLLSAIEQKNAKKMGMTHAEFLEAKKEHAAKESE